MSHTLEIPEAALFYAQRRWPVFPLHSMENGRCTCGKAHCSAAAKHPRTAKGFHDATTDERTIRKWWALWPQANVGIRTGNASGLLVLDIDPRNGGADTLATWERTHGSIPFTPEAVTGGGGRHFLFQYPAGHIKSGPLAAGIDLKGEGGYIVAAPSLHASGVRYHWRPGHAPDNVQPVPFPSWLMTLQRQEVISPGLKQERSYWRGVVRDGAMQGERNVVTARLIGHLLRHHIDPAVALHLVLAWNQIHNKPPLPVAEVIRTVDSIAGRELQRRRGAVHHG